MNVQKIFDALQEDQDNPRLGIICAELEEQDYKALLDGKEVTSAGIFDCNHNDLEDHLGALNGSFLQG